MIKNVYIDGVKVNNEFCYLAGLRNIANADIDINTYTRGGRSGQSVSRPVYRGFAISMDWVVHAKTAEQLLSQRERLMRLFRNTHTGNASYLKRLGVELANGVIKEVNSVFTPIQGNIMPENIQLSEFKVTAISQKEFLESSVLKTTNIQQADYGGMAIPMPIPLDMANNPTALSAIATNNGTAETYPIITVHGETASGFDLINETTGKTLTYDVTLDAGDYIELDFYNRTAVKNGTTNVLADISGEWWYLATGTNSLKISTTGGEGYAVAEYRDAYRGI